MRKSRIDLEIKKSQKREKTKKERVVKIVKKIEKFLKSKKLSPSKRYEYELKLQRYQDNLTL